MVYTTGGSKACGTCRKRKIRCDLGLPECQHCFTTGRKCSGYSRKYNFVAVTPGVRVGRTVAPREKRASRHATESVTNTTICRSPNNRSAYCDLLSGPFQDVFAPLNQDSGIVKILPCGWLRLMPGLLHGRSDLLNNSLLALYTGFIGSQKKDMQLKYISLQLYSDALGSLRRNQILSYQRNFSGTDVLLATIVILSRCELLASNEDGDGHMVHVRAGLELLRRSAFNLPNTPFARLLVRKFRCLGFYDAVRHRKTFFMSDPPFNELFLAERGDADYFTQRCLESVIQLPSIMEAADKLETTQFKSPEEKRGGQIMAARLLHVASNIEKSLSSWWTEIQEIVKPPTLSGIITLQANAPINYTPPLLHYKNSEDSDLWALYWSISIYLHELIGQIQARYLAIGAGISTFHQLPQELVEVAKDHATLDMYAENICGSVFSGLRSCPFTVHETMIALFTTQWYYGKRGESEKLLWCKGVMRLLEPESIARGDSGRDRPRWCSVIFQ